MDIVGTFEMAQELSKLGYITCLHKHYTIEEWDEFATKYPNILAHIAVSSGTGCAELDRAQIVLERS